MNRKPRILRPRGKSAPVLPRNLEIDIVELGGRGDGVGTHDDQSVFVPGTVPGDRVLVRVEGRKSDRCGRQRRAIADARSRPRDAGLPAFRPMRRLFPAASRRRPL